MYNGAKERGTEVWLVYKVNVSLMASLSCISPTYHVYHSILPLLFPLPRESAMGHDEANLILAYFAAKYLSVQKYPDLFNWIASTSAM